MISMTGLTWSRLGSVQVGGVGGGLGRGPVCQKVAAVLAGVEVVVLHLQIMHTCRLLR